MSEYLLDDGLDEMEEELDAFRAEQKSFCVDCDARAEWAMHTVSDERAEAARLARACDKMAKHYADKGAKYLFDAERNTAYLTRELERYFNMVKHKRTKTQESYQLPSGKLIRKLRAPDVERNDEALIEWLRSSEETRAYIKKTEVPMWGELKKVLERDGDEMFYSGSGEIVPGIKLVAREPVFEVSVSAE